MGTSILNADPVDTLECDTRRQHGDDGMFIPNKLRLAQVRYEFAALLTRPVNLTADRPRRVLVPNHDIFDDMVVPDSALAELNALFT